MLFQKGDKFWSRKPKRPAMKNVKPPSKKSKGKGKAAMAEPSEVEESQVGDVLSEIKVHPLFTCLSLLLIFVFISLSLLK